MNDKNSVRLSIPGRVTEEPGNNGLMKLILTHPSGARVEIYRHGAHITSWRTAAGVEQFFLSPQSQFHPDRPIRGGIPVVFPQFGDGPLPKHGFARILPWTPVASAETGPGAVTLTFQIEDSAATRAYGAPSFRTRLHLELEPETLTLTWSVLNRSGSPWSFTGALHTYFRVADIRRAAVEGLQGIALVDSLQADRREVESRDQIRFAEEVDRVYVAAPDRLAVIDEVETRRVEITKTGMADAVVWNPWIDKSKRLEDFGDNDYRQMVCVETGNIDAPIRLVPGADWSGSTRFSSEDGRK
jgi:glucose-6-phosphate 1-epimerase